MFSSAEAMEDKAGCGAVGSVLRSGRRGRKFESSHPDKRKGLSAKAVGLFLFNHPLEVRESHVSGMSNLLTRFQMELG